MDSGLVQILTYVGIAVIAVLVSMVVGCLLYNRRLQRDRAAVAVHKAISQPETLQSQALILPDVPTQSSLENDIQQGSVRSHGMANKSNKGGSRPQLTVSSNLRTDSTTFELTPTHDDKSPTGDELPTKNPMGKAVYDQIYKSNSNFNTQNSQTLTQQLQQQMAAQSNGQIVPPPLMPKPRTNSGNNIIPQGSGSKTNTLKGFVQNSQPPSNSNTYVRNITNSNQRNPDRDPLSQWNTQEDPATPVSMPAPLPIDSVKLPQSARDIQQAKSQAMRIKIDLGGKSADGTSIATKSPEQTVISPTGNILSNYVTFMDNDSTYVNLVVPLAIPAFREAVQNTDYRLGIQVAKGGTSVIYMADLLTDELRNCNPSEWGAVAKVMQESDLMQQDDVFHQEIAIMHDLSDHINFVRLLGFSESPKTIIMPYYRFGSLKDLVFKKNKEFMVPDEQWDLFMIRALLLDVATALAHMHSKNISHNDIKPDNVMLNLLPSKTLICLLTDFSISSITSDERMGVKALKKSHLVGLSVAYAAPEIVQAFFEFRKAQKKDPNVEMQPVQGPVHGRDSYSFGIMSYEVTTRVKAYDGLNRDEIRRVVLRGQRPLYPDHMIQRRISDRNWGIICNITETCWSADANFRLTMDGVVKRLLAVNL